MFDSPAHGGDPDDHDQPDPSAALAEHRNHCELCAEGQPCDDVDDLYMAALEAEPLTFLAPEAERRDVFDEPEHGGEG